MRKFLLATAAGLILPSLAWATDARLTYKTASGMYAQAAIGAMTCGVNSSGVPQLCQTDGVTSSDTTSALITYQTASGQWATALPTVPVCGVTDGVPQICTFSDPDMSLYLTTATAATTYAQLADQNSFTAEQHFANAYYADPDPGASRDAKFGDKGIAVGGGTKTDTLTVTGASSVIDTDATDSSKSILNTESAAARFVSSTTAASTYETIAGTTAAVQKAIGATQGSVTGDISASGSSLTLPVGSSGLNLVMSYSASGTGALTAVSASGTLTPVDIYEVASWGTTSFKGYTLDSGTITTTPTTVDSTFYLTSNAWGTYHIGVGGHLYIVDIFGSGAGKRTFMSWRLVQ